MANSVSVTAHQASHSNTSLPTKNKIISYRANILSPHQIDHYHQLGFLVLDDFIPAEVCQLLIKQAKSLIEQYDTAQHNLIFSTTDQRHAANLYFLNSYNKIHYFFEQNAFDQVGNLVIPKQQAINKMGHALHQLDPVFYCFSRLHKLAVLLAELGVSQPTLLQSMYICKQPFIGDEVTCHQDATYLTLAEGHVTGLWIALEDATIQNGCLWAIPGGHGTPLKSRMFRELDDRIHTQIYDETPWDMRQMIPLEVKQGSVIVLHGLLPHMSKVNTSAHSRNAYTLHVKDATQQVAAGNWFAPNGQSDFARMSH